MELLGILLGLALGLMAGTLPGMHLASVFVLLLGMGAAGILPPVPLALMLVTATGVTVSTRALSKTFHPTAMAALPFADPAVRMAYDGKGLTALTLLNRATLTASTVAIPLTLLFVFLAQTNMAPGKLPTALALLAIGVWGYYTAKKSQSPALTAATMGAAGLYGYVVLHIPFLRGSEHAMSPLLGGLFAIPAGLSIFLESTASKFPRQRPAQVSLMPSRLTGMGLVIGTFSGFLAGLSAGSAVSVLNDQTGSDEEFVFFHALAETMNDLVAVGLALAVGLGRSGEAAILNNLLPDANLPIALACILALGMGLWVGLKALPHMQTPYVKLVTHLNPKLFAGVAIAVALFGAYAAAGLLGILLTLPGVGLALFARANFLPAQTSLAALAFPVLAYYAGWIPALNSLLF